MIPNKVAIPILCDCCGATVSVTLSEDDIDGAGWDMAIEGALIDRDWGTCECMTFCPRCMDQARTLALRELARGAQGKVRGGVQDVVV